MREYFNTLKASDIMYFHEKDFLQYVMIVHAN